MSLFGSIWSPFLLEVWDDAAFEEDEIFQGQFSIFCPFCVKNVRFWDIYVAWRGWSIPFARLRAFCKKLELVLNCVPNLHSLRKCHEQFYCNFCILLKNAVFFTAKWLRIWCIQMMHSNFEFTDAPDPEVSGCTWDPVGFLVQKILSETGCFALVSVWQLN